MTKDSTESRHPEQNWRLLWAMGFSPSLKIFSWEEEAGGMFVITVPAGTTEVSDQRLQRRILWSLKNRHAEGGYF